MDSENIPWEEHKYYLLLIVIGFSVYFNALFGAFVWDDIAQVQENGLIQSLVNLPSFFLGGTYAPQTGSIGAGIYYRPLMSFLFALIYPISGGQPFLFHFIQVFIHLVNAYFIFILFKKFLREKLAFLLALIFAVHPLNVEAVSFISSLGEPLFVLAGLSALLLFIKKRSKKRTLLVGALLLCSLFAKETGVLFLIILFSYYLIFTRKKWRIYTTLSLTIIPLAIYLFMRFNVAKVYIIRLPDVPMMTAPLADRVFTMPAIFWFYIKTFFFPQNLFILQRWSVLDADGHFFLPLTLVLLILLGVILIGVWIQKTNKYNFPTFLFFTIWFLVGIGIHMQIVPLDFTVADRYFYFAMIGLLGLIGVSLSTIKRTPLLLKNIGIVSIILLIIVLSVRTIIRNTNWTDGLSLYSHDLQYQQSNIIIQNAVAVELANAGRLDEANQHFKDLLQRYPKESAFYFNVASIYEDEKKIIEAEDVYRKGLVVDNSGALYAGLARMLLQQEKFSQARKVSEEGLSKFPQNSNLWILQAVADYKLGNKKKAIEEAQKAKDIMPNQTTQNIFDAIVHDLPL